MLIAAMGCAQSEQRSSTPITDAGSDTDSTHETEPNPELGTPPSDAADPSASPDEDWPADCEYRVVLRAHGQSAAGDRTPYAIAAGSEYHAAFYFEPAIGDAPLQLLKSRELVDNRKFIHHNMLYAIHAGDFDDGAILNDLAQSLILTDPSTGAEYLLGGVPGTNAIDMPDGVGLRMPAGKLALVLVVHYLNPSDTRAVDRSGVEVCLTSKKRPVDATAHWLGKLELNLPPHEHTDVTQTCTPELSQGRAHIMALTPHMHLMATHSNVVLRRASGQSITLLDKPFTFSEQRMYHMPEDGSAADVVIERGDSIITTCSFDNTTDNEIIWGQHSTDEMCFLTVWAWPAGSIRNQSGLGPELGIKPDQACLD